MISETIWKNQRTRILKYMKKISKDLRIVE